jgi:multidrug resistance efflux pump
VTPEESVASLKELLLSKLESVLDLIREKDTLYTDRDTARQKAVEAALKAAQTGVDAAFAASEKAIGKSDQNAEKWRAAANEWRAAMQDREVKFASRTEVDNELKNLRVEMQSLKESRAETTGERRQQGDTRAWWLAGISTAGLILALVTFMLRTAAVVPPSAPQVIYVPAPAGALLPSTPPQPVPR